MIAEPKPPPAVKHPTIALLSDYGSSDYRVGAMKGRILEVNPEAAVVDLSHDVPAFDLLAGAFTLRAAYYDYPLNTIFVVAVDPGSGPKRRPILVKTENYWFLGPDNGVFSFIYDCERMVAVRHVVATHYFKTPVNPAFFGRDVYASSAAYLARSYVGDDFGEAVQDYARINVPKPKGEGQQLKGMVLLADRYGNVITNFDLRELRALMDKHGLERYRASVGGKGIGPLAASYGEGQGELFLVEGGTGFLEIAAPQKSARDILGAQRGQEVILSFG